MSAHHPSDPEALRFDHFEIRPTERLLLVGGGAVAVGARAFDLLLALAQQRGQLVSKQELLDTVWPGLVVEEHNIAAQISSLRKLLGTPCIATVPGRGYRLTATPAGAPAQTQAAAEGSVQAQPPATPRHHLPEPRTRFIGREAALGDLARLVPQSRLLTLTGIGGSGKTRLALQFARGHAADFADSVWFVDLAPLAEAGRVVAACAAVLEIGKEFEAPSAATVAAHLAERQALIVLDNCEQVQPHWPTRCWRTPGSRASSPPAGSRWASWENSCIRCVRCHCRPPPTSTT